ncbi:MAG: acyl-CoA thioesterase [Balneolaceae bacterium]|nr:MAG: acyl-CoA thioesterase [Balneolaceae bacterium]
MNKPAFHPSRFFHWTEINVRFRDIDALNHVNNAVFNTYFEEARVRFIHDIPGFMKSMDEGHSFVLVRIEVDYIRPIFLTETVLIGSSIEEYGNTSIKGFQAIYSKETKELKAMARTTGVWFNLASQRPAKLPEIRNRDQYLYKNEING